MIHRVHEPAGCDVSDKRHVSGSQGGIRHELCLSSFKWIEEFLGDFLCLTRSCLQGCNSTFYHKTPVVISSQLPHRKLPWQNYNFCTLIIKWVNFFNQSFRISVFTPKVYFNKQGPATLGDIFINHESNRLILYLLTTAFSDSGKISLTKFYP